MRKIFETTNGTRQVKVYRNAEFGEYQAKLYIKGAFIIDATYFTDDKMDAIDTARHMVNWS